MATIIPTTSARPHTPSAIGGDANHWPIHWPAIASGTKVLHNQLKSLVVDVVRCERVSAAQIPGSPPASYDPAAAYAAYLIPSSPSFPLIQLGARFAQVYAVDRNSPPALQTA
jgi:hypothetical protein